MSHTHDPPPPVVVTAREHLEEIVPELAAGGRLAVDTESNGFYAYKEKVCLLQFSTPTTDYIVDPIAAPDLSPLAPLMADPSLEKIFHAGEFDILCLKRDHGFRFANLFDTMIASRLLGAKELGLAAAIERHFGVKLSKKLQRADWGKRPMSHAQIQYAQGDTHYLIRLADILKEQLRAKGRAEDAQEAFEELASVEPVGRSFDPEGFWKISGSRRLGAPQTCCLREIYLFREEQAQSRDRAPFRVMPEDLMVRLAEAMPETQADLAKVRGMSPYLLQRYGYALLKAVKRGKEAAHAPPTPPRPARPRRDYKEWKLFESLRQWRKEQAAREGVDPVVILPSESLRELARLACLDGGDPLNCLTELKAKRYGEMISRLLRGEKPA